MKLQHDQPTHRCQECDIRDEVIDDLRKQLAEERADHECTMKNWEYACALREHLVSFDEDEMAAEPDAPPEEDEP